MTVFVARVRLVHARIDCAAAEQRRDKAATMARSRARAGSVCARVPHSAHAKRHAHKRRATSASCWIMCPAGVCALLGPPCSFSDCDLTPVMCERIARVPAPVHMPFDAPLGACAVCFACCAWKQQCMCTCCPGVRLPACAWRRQPCRRLLALSGPMTLEVLLV